MASTYSLPAKDQLGDSYHSAVGAWFFGPRAENFDLLTKHFETILKNQKDARQNTYPDSDFITDDMKATVLFSNQSKRLDEDLEWVTSWLSKTSVPFWTPRYNGHMSMESSMPAVVGYLAGLLHNQNNVATEASAMTTWLEYQVGKGLCYMLGYNIQFDNRDDPSHPWFIPGHNIPVEDGDPYDDEPKDEADRPIGWGHVTCGGSIANLESIWAARNLKFYPLSLKLALAKKGSILGFLKDRFKITTCDGVEKLFMKCETWELLNLKPSTVLRIPNMLFDQFGVSQNTLTKVLAEFTIQTTGKDYLEKEFEIERPAHILIGTTRHYSWPKGAAIAGIGRGQIINIALDEKARMDAEDLRAKLELAVKERRAIYAVVAIIGSTEHGAVDPLISVLKLRQEFEAKGLSFVVHCDGAWGGYFAACIRDFDVVNHTVGITDGETMNDVLARQKTGFVPTSTLIPYTKKQLAWLGRADSITIDPHKSGYCPYPAGGLCYRDGRMRYLVTWTSPYIYSGQVESIGVYGVEGSKPGAAAVGAWLSHKIINLDKSGYGTLLGEAIYTCARLYCHWATMEFETIQVPGGTARVIVTPFTMLPVERDGGTPEEIEKQKQFIRDRIIGKTNEDIYNDPEASRLITELGGDLQINAFAVNFELNGVVNEDVIEANYLNNRIFSRCCITDWQDTEKTLKDVKIILTSTTFAQEDYKSCLDTYKRRLGLKGDQDLYSLINVTMNPWATSADFVQEMADVFRDVANEELPHVAARNAPTPDYHTFKIQAIDGDRVCGVYLSKFNSQNHRMQLIISFKLPEATVKIIREQSEKDPKAFFTLTNTYPDEVSNFIQNAGSFAARFDSGIPSDKSQEPLATGEVTEIEIIYQKSLELKNLSTQYPENMLLYAYSAQRGTDETPIFNVDHLLSVALDIQLNSDAVKFEVDGMSEDEAKRKVRDEGAWFKLTDIYERVLQPLLQDKDAPKTGYTNPGLNWNPGATFEFVAYAAGDRMRLPEQNASALFKGVLTLGERVFADAYMLNADAPLHPVYKVNDDGTGDSGGVFSLATSFSLFGLQESNASGLVAEYPNSSQMPELRLRNQANRMRLFQDCVMADAPKDIASSSYDQTLRG